MNEEEVESEGAYSVEIRFRGLCPFVPGANLEEGKNPSWVGAFLVDASARNLKNFEAGDLPAHYPFLEYRVSDLVGMEHAPSVSVFSALDQEDVVFLPPPGSPEELRVDFSRSGVGEVPQPGEEGLFNWVTPMDGVMPGRGEVDPECFSDNPSARLVARIHIVQGLLQTGRFGLFKDQALVVPLAENGSQKRHAVAKEGLLTIDCAAGAFRIRLKKFKEKDTAEQPARELVFRQPPAGENLKIVVSNLCGCEILPAKGDDLSQAEALNPDEDFRCNYILSKGVNSIKDGLVPVPALAALNPEVKKTGKGDGGGGSDGSQCSPPRTGSSPQPASLAMINRAVGILQEGAHS